MASNFSIRHRRGKDGLFLKLSGDFDGSSAFELHHCLQAVLTENRRVIIDTESVSSLPAFGRDVFQKQFGTQKRTAKRVVFTGARATDLAPEGCRTQG